MAPLTLGCTVSRVSHAAVPYWTLERLRMAEGGRSDGHWEKQASDVGGPVDCWKRDGQRINGSAGII